MVTNGAKAIRGYDAATGKELWTLEPNSEVTCTTPVAAHGLVFVTAGYPPVRPIYAVKQGARGDLTLPEGEESSDAIAWSNKRGVYLPSPIVVGEHLYALANNGILSCYKARTGERIYRERVGVGSFSAAPVAAAGKLYLSSEDGDIYVVEAGPVYELLAKNPMGEILMATPAFSGDLLIVRGHKNLFAIR